MTRGQLLERAEDLLVDARDKRNRIARKWPERLPTAQLMVDDVARAYSLIESYRKPPSGRRMLEIESRLTRACLLSEALSNESQ